MLWTGGRSSGSAVGWALFFFQLLLFLNLREFPLCWCLSCCLPGRARVSLVCVQSAVVRMRSVAGTWFGGVSLAWFCVALLRGAVFCSVWFCGLVLQVEWLVMGSAEQQFMWPLGAAGVCGLRLLCFARCVVQCTCVSRVKIFRHVVVFAARCEVLESTLSWVVGVS